MEQFSIIQLEIWTKTIHPNWVLLAYSRNLARCIETKSLTYSKSSPILNNCEIASHVYTFLGLIMKKLRLRNEYTDSCFFFFKYTMCFMWVKKQQKNENTYTFTHNVRFNSRIVDLRYSTIRQILVSIWRIDKYFGE